MIAIAIDGPAGAGKSTLARATAKKLSFIYVDTGALYRTMTLFCLRRGVDPGDAKGVIGLLSQAVIELKYVKGEQRVLLNGEDVTAEIRSQKVTMGSASVSALAEVRQFLLDLQKDMAKQNNVVMDGRDIGTVVLPKADVKIFLTASPQERARRRVADYEARGEQVNPQEILAEILKRDSYDQSRLVSPLKKAEDAVEVDTTGQTLDQSLACVMNVIKGRIGDVAL